MGARVRFIISVICLLFLPRWALAAPMPVNAFVQIRAGDTVVPLTTHGTISPGQSRFLQPLMSSWGAPVRVDYEVATQELERSLRFRFYTTGLFGITPPLVNQAAYTSLPDTPPFGILMNVEGLADPDRQGLQFQTRASLYGDGQVIFQSSWMDGMGDFPTRRGFASFTSTPAMSDFFNGGVIADEMRFELSYQIVPEPITALPVLVALVFVTTSRKRRL